MELRWRGSRIKAGEAGVNDQVFDPVVLVEDGVDFFAGGAGDEGHAAGASEGDAAGTGQEVSKESDHGMKVPARIGFAKGRMG